MRRPRLLTGLTGEVKTVWPRHKKRFPTESGLGCGGGGGGPANGFEKALKKTAFLFPSASQPETPPILGVERPPASRPTSRRGGVSQPTGPVGWGCRAGAPKRPRPLVLSALFGCPPVSRPMGPVGRGYRVGSPKQGLSGCVGRAPPPKKVSRPNRPFWVDAPHRAARRRHPFDRGSPFSHGGVWGWSVPLLTSATGQCHFSSASTN